MKNKLIIIIILLVSYFTVFSQRRVNVGIKAGGTITGLVGSGMPDSYNYMYDFTGGAFLNAKFTEHRSFLFELNYIRKSFNFTEDITLLTGGILFLQERKDYISVPIQFKIMLGDDFLNTFFNIGFEFDFLVNEERKGTATVGEYSVSYEGYYDYKNNTFDYGFVAGIGARFKAVSLEVTGL